MSTLPPCPPCTLACACEDGTKVKNIRLIDGFGPMQLKSEFIKKA